jgi:hypothetical protein
MRIKSSVPTISTVKGLKARTKVKIDTNFLPKSPCLIFRII